ncbi:MAG: YceI family protein [Rhizobacter sp.]|nr:YceI family protein [Ferruginibacter sp.]
MKKITVLLCSLTIMFNTMAQGYIPKDEKQAVSFVIKNFGLTVNGSFPGLLGSITFNPSNVTASLFNVTVDASSISTGNNSRDGHLKKEEYFNTAIFKKISLVSSQITNGAVQGSYLFDGVLSIKGTKKSISFPFTAMPTTEGYLFNGSFKINRRDFKVGGSSLVLSDNLTVLLRVQAKRS